ncbi:hypothetical protein CF326_g6754 [Tilletia indica]|nr:hypothetical protein CF326_g6754 [Tilletia indica]
MAQEMEEEEARGSGPTTASPPRLPDDSEASHSVATPTTFSYAALIASRPAPEPRASSPGSTVLTPATLPPTSSSSSTSCNTYASRLQPSPSASVTPPRSSSTPRLSPSSLPSPSSDLPFSSTLDQDSSSCTLTSAPAPSAIGGSPRPGSRIHTSAKPATYDGGLDLALCRVREGWIAARRALASPAILPTSVAADTIPWHQAKIEARLNSIERAQSRLFPLLSSASPLASGHGTFSAAQQRGAPCAVNSPPSSAMPVSPPIIAAPLTELSASAGSSTQSVMLAAPLCLPTSLSQYALPCSNSQLPAFATPTLHNSFSSPSPSSQLSTPLVPLTTAPHHGYFFSAWSQLHFLLRHLVASLPAISTLHSGSQMFTPSHRPPWLYP